MQVILHIGYHKTGSTAIQQALPRLTASLANAGIDLPGSLSQWLGNPDLAWGFDGKDYPWQDRRYSREEVLAHYTPLLEAAAEANRTLLLTSEEFCRMDFNPAALADLAEFLRPYNPLVLGMVRDPLDFLLSRWRHEVQMGSEARPLGVFLADPDNLSSADFGQRTEFWRQSFGRSACRFQDYAALTAAHGGSLLPGFLESIGAAELASEVTNEPDSEQKLHPLLCDAARAVASSTLDSKRKGALFEQLFALGDNLPPCRLEALLAAHPLSQPLTGQLDHIRHTMVERGLLALG